MAMIGYARVSTTDQDLSIQEAALKAAGCDIVRAEKVSGTSTNGREELKTVLQFLRPGDILVVTRLDRLARSILDLAGIVEQLRVKGAFLKATEQGGIDTSKPEGRAFIGMLGVFAQFETEIRKERQLEGIAKAKADGVYKGGKVRIDHARVRELHVQGVGATAIAEALGISRMSVYRVLGEE